MTITILNELVKYAADYSVKAEDSISRNSHMNNIPVKQKVSRDVAEAVLVDFINTIAMRHGIDFGLYTSDLHKHQKGIEVTTKTKVPTEAVLKERNPNIIKTKRADTEFFELTFEADDKVKLKTVYSKSCSNSYFKCYFLEADGSRPVGCRNCTSSTKEITGPCFNTNNENELNNSCMFVEVQADEFDAENLKREDNEKFETTILDRTIRLKTVYYEGCVSMNLHNKCYYLINGSCKNRNWKTTGLCRNTKTTGKSNQCMFVLDLDDIDEESDVDLSLKKSTYDSVMDPELEKILKSKINYSNSSREDNEIFDVTLKTGETVKLKCLHHDSCGTIASGKCYFTSKYGVCQNGITDQTGTCCVRSETDEKKNCFFVEVKPDKI